MKHALTLGMVRGSEEFSLPIDLVTQSIAILAKKRVGKSYTAAVVAEEMLGAGQQVVIIDPTGAHWGLRSSADGKSAGFPIVVIGGDHADLPLEESSGEVLARAIVEQCFSAIIDLSWLRKKATTRFLAAFFETLYRMNRTPLHLICDEADAYAPQKPFAEEARTLGAMEDIVRRGGIRGIGTTLITQRPAVINKNVLTQCEILIALRIVHPKDIAAVMEWVNVHAEPAEAKAMLDSLPSLPVGMAWFWSPGWGGIFDKVAVRRRQTFDSGATPKPGERVVAPNVLAPIDVQRLGDEITATIERAKADDPKELRRRIAELEDELAARATEKPEIQRIEIPVFSDTDYARINAAIEPMEQAAKAMRDAVVAARNLADQPGSTSRSAAAAATPMPDIRHELLPPRKSPAPAPRRETSNRSGQAALSKAERKILTVLAQYPGGRAKNQVAVLTGYAVGGGGFNNAISACRSRGYLTGSSVGGMVITESGLEALGDFEPLPTGRALLDYWCLQLKKAERSILEVLVAIYPMAATKAEVAERAGYEAAGGGFNNALSRLRTLELITRGTEMRASADLFERPGR